jgi:hypothetical protein
MQMDNWFIILMEFKRSGKVQEGKTKICNSKALQKNNQPVPCNHQTFPSFLLPLYIFYKAALRCFIGMFAGFAF